MTRFLRHLLVGVAYVVAAAALITFALSMGLSPLRAVLAATIGILITIAAAELCAATEPDRQPCPDPHGCTCQQFTMPHRHTSHRQTPFFRRILRIFI